MRPRLPFAALLFLAVVTSCHAQIKRAGAIPADDGPSGPPPAELDALQDPELRAEPLNTAANAPYSVFGKQYVPYREPVQYRRQGVISWYGRRFHGKATWSGEIFDMYALTAAHPTLPIPSYARVTNLENGRSVVVRVNDRGPFHAGRIMDVSYAAAYKLGFSHLGSVMAEVEALAAGSAPAALTAAMPEPMDPRPTLHTSAEARGIYLQLGAFQSLLNAESFRDKIAPQLAELNLGHETPLRDKLYRVQVGPFLTRDEARRTAGRLRDTLGIQPVFVVR